MCIYIYIYIDIYRYRYTYIIHDLDKCWRPEVPTSGRASERRPHADRARVRDNSNSNINSDSDNDSDSNSNTRDVWDFEGNPASSIRRPGTQQPCAFFLRFLRFARNPEFVPSEGARPAVEDGDGTLTLEVGLAQRFLHRSFRASLSRRSGCSQVELGLRVGQLRAACERLAEYGWKPHRDFLARKSQSPAPFYWYMRETQRGTVSSNSRFQTILFQQYSANLSTWRPAPS